MAKCFSRNTVVLMSFVNLDIICFNPRILGLDFIQKKIISNFKNKLKVEKKAVEAYSDFSKRQIWSQVD